jgi:hypothetical protein
LAEALASSVSGSPALTGWSSRKRRRTVGRGCGLNPPLDACTQAALTPSNPETFLSLEQSTPVREDFACLVAALEAVVP